MKPLFKQGISFALGLVITLIFLGLAFKNVPFQDIHLYFSKINYLYLIPPLIMVILTFLIRTLRWYLLLDRRLPFSLCFHFLMSGFMLNCILPARMGEVARPLLVGRAAVCTFSEAVSSIVVERLFDMVTLLILFYGLLFHISIPEDLSYTVGHYHLDKALLMTIIFTTLKIAALILTALGFIGYQKTRNVLLHTLQRVDGFTAKKLGTGNKARMLQRWVIRPVTQFINNFATGVDCIKRRATFFYVLMLSFLIWGVQGTSYLLVAKAVPGMTLGFFELTFVMIVICFFIAIPSVPGFWGVWEAGGVFAMMIFGMEGSDVVGYHLINHVVQLLPVMLIGFVSAWVIGFAKLFKSTQLTTCAGIFFLFTKIGGVPNLWTTL